MRVLLFRQCNITETLTVILTPWLIANNFAMVSQKFIHWKAGAGDKIIQ